MECYTGIYVSHRQILQQQQNGDTIVHMSVISWELTACSILFPFFFFTIYLCVKELLGKGWANIVYEGQKL